MTNFMILLVVLFVLSLIILWMILDYHFIRLNKLLNSKPLVVTGKLTEQEQEMLLKAIKEHNAKIELVDPCGFTQPLSES
ncbi:hypothetical protein AYK86_03510 [Acinetobacter venetianus]|uniref:hypothetical protein n=1 Tax=Acinetobacter venetianus TaxID=52133 RepID=UPI000775C104|nr:hypothetical protein [Acinetobacter venetianus]KXO86099.1 hypothetical protein AYK86_03510 [Acinetobacter venetianus]